MGFQTTIMILNDALGEIDNDPKGWWEKTSEMIKAHRGNSDPQSYGFGSFSNGFTLVDVHHADVTSVIAVGGNYSTILSKLPRQSHHSEEHELELIKKLAKKHGYKLVKE